MARLKVVEAKQPTLEPYYADSPEENFVLYQGDSLSLLPQLAPESFDFIFADPPYFLSNGGMTCKSGKMVSVDKGKWDRSAGIQANHAFNRAWLEQCQRSLKPNGTLMISGTHHTIYSIGFALQELGFKILNDITWFKPNAPPNLCCRYFTHSTETILWAARGDRSRHTFNYAEMKEENGGKQMRSMWTFTAPRKEEKLHGKHPTQKPLALLDRIIRAATQEGDRVLDPFNGSGTTGIAAAMNGRRYAGIELNEEYLELSINRYRDVNPEVTGAQDGSITRRCHG